jgi:hypothetical protein
MRHVTVSASGEARAARDVREGFDLPLPAEERGLRLAAPPLTVRAHLADGWRQPGRSSSRNKEMSLLRRAPAVSAVRATGERGDGGEVGEGRVATGESERGTGAGNGKARGAADGGWWWELKRRLWAGQWTGGPSADELPALEQESVSESTRKSRVQGRQTAHGHERTSHLNKRPPTERPQDEHDGSERLEKGPVGGA